MLDETLQAFMDFQKGLLGQLDARQKEILAANTKLVYELQVINTNRLQTEPIARPYQKLQWYS